MRFRKLVIVVLLALSSPTTTGCEEESQAPTLDENEAEEIRRILTTGVDHPDDPYVRAETFRVVELLKDERLAEIARKGVDDDDPMVRVAALRASLASNHARGRALALDMFRNEKGDVQGAVLEAALAHGSPPLRREIVGRALRTTDANLRIMAFERGLLKRIDQAKSTGNEETLNRHLIPELGTYVSMDDPALAALALAKFEELGETDRAEPIVEKFANRRNPADLRVRAGSILVRAHASAARPEFERVMKRWERSMKSDELGLPQKVVAQDVLRIAMLGTIATGDTTYVERAQRYTKNVKTDEMLEVLEALSTNPSKDAEVSLRIAMQDARSAVRRFAIEAYKDRDDASPEALYDILPAAPFETQRQIAQILWTKFPAEWIAANTESLQRASEVSAALRLLRNVVTRPDEVQHIVGLESTLKKVAKSNKEENANLARYLLRLIAESKGEDDAEGVSLESLDERTTYAYLELLVTSGADAADTYRRYFYADNFALRLMSAAGLWRVTGGSAAQQSGEVDAGR